MADKKYISAALLTTALLAVVLIYAANGSSTTGFVLSNTEERCKLAEISYEIKENYLIPLNYEVISSMSGISKESSLSLATGEVVIKNTDSKDGLFLVEQILTVSNKSIQTKRSSAEIIVGESKKFQVRFDKDVSGIENDFDVSYKITPDKKEYSVNRTKYEIEEKCS